jgi:hypothetical protein
MRTRNNTYPPGRSAQNFWQYAESASSSLKYFTIPVLLVGTLVCSTHPVLYSIGEAARIQAAVARMATAPVIPRRRFVNERLIASRKRLIDGGGRRVEPFRRTVGRT